MQTLTEVGKKHFTEKVSHGFLDLYEKLWEDKFERNDFLSLLEIGIYNGNSMRTWCEWFPKALIVGIDKYPQPRSNESRATLRFGDQGDEEFLTKIGQEFEGFHIIIDDGGHIWREQQISFETLWPFVYSGGMYIIEDLHTSADKFWAKGSTINTIDYLRNVVGWVVLDETSDIKCIEFYPKLCVIHKR